MLRFFIAFAALAAMLPGVGSAKAQSMRLDGWWIVLNSIRDDGTNGPRDEMLAFMQRVRRDCGLHIFNDYSNRFAGFTPGLLVATTIGAYPSEAAAQQALPQIRRCVPDAYAKYARHRGR